MSSLYNAYTPPQIDALVITDSPLGFGPTRLLGGLAFFEPAMAVTPAGFVANLVSVTLGNIVGGSVFVALVYWLCYLQHRQAPTAPGDRAT